ncbi:MAG TPA: glycosyl transferase family 1 [Chloroflexi bacterium]|nr:glycosyl transferase family 1 [Chloroflexota bacterium]HHW89168.1 glycosyltransferase family 4 protein [Chloroflexota bacterium]
MRVLMVSKAFVVGAYQRKAEELARLGVELVVLTPPSWRDRRGVQVLQRRHTQGYTLRAIPIRFNGNFHLHYYPTLKRELHSVAPDVLHFDEEPYNLATWLALRLARQAGIPATFFTWQNLDRRYPFPFSAFERTSYRTAPIAIAGNRDAAKVLRRKGFTGEIAVIPQFGVDPAIFAPDAVATTAPGRESLRIGYAGGLLPEKGLTDLLHACAALRGDWRLTLAGEGSEAAALQKLVAALSLQARVHFVGRIDSSAMPAFYRTLDVFVLPSRTTPGWKEQFGRVLIEAMACGVPVIGSDSGEIPHVIGAAGLIFPEGDRATLTAQLQRLCNEPGMRAELAAAGRQRVLAHYTMAQIAAQTVAIYRQLVEGA